MKRWRLWLIATIAVTVPIEAFAYGGFVTANINLRAGPDVGYPAITVVPAGAPVDIQGCIDGWTWCDVIAGPDRGWLAGNYLQNDYDGRRVVVNDYGARIGIPIIAFSLGAYWGSHYHSRPWYRNRGSWERRHFAHRLPGPPRGYHGAYHGAYHGNNHDNGRHDYGHDRRNDHRSGYRGPTRASRTTVRHSTVVRHTAPVRNVHAPAHQSRAAPAQRANRSRAAAPRTTPNRAAAHVARPAVNRAPARAARPASKHDAGKNHHH